VGRIMGCLRQSTITVQVCCDECVVGKADENTRLAMYPMMSIDAAQDVTKVSGRLRSYFVLSRIHGGRFTFRSDEYC
jgi:hypothetical protein